MAMPSLMDLLQSQDLFQKSLSVYSKDLDIAVSEFSKLHEKRTVDVPFAHIVSVLLELQRYPSLRDIPVTSFLDDVTTLRSDTYALGDAPMMRLDVHY
jgi:hypothetical protein